MKRVFFVAVALSVLGGAAYVALPWLKNFSLSEYNYGDAAFKVRKLEDDLRAEPCDRPKTKQLLNEMLNAGNNRGVIDRAEAFYKKCGDFMDLRALTYRAHARLSEYKAAIADTTTLVNSEKSNAYYLAWRGIVYEEANELELAADDFRQSLLLRPDLSDIPFNLANVYEKQGKVCDAVFPLQQLVYHYPERPWIAEVRSRITNLEAKGGCGVSSASAKKIAIRLDPAHTEIKARVRVNDTENGAFVVDTGASYVTLSRGFAARLGLQLAGAPSVTLQTANGETRGQFVSLKSVSIDGLKAERIPAVVVDDLGGDMDGLLGLSFLGLFELKHSRTAIEISIPN